MDSECTGEGAFAAKQRNSICALVHVKLPYTQLISLNWSHWSMGNKHMKLVGGVWFIWKWAIDGEHMYANQSPCNTLNIWSHWRIQGILVMYSCEIFCWLDLQYTVSHFALSFKNIRALNLWEEEMVPGLKFCSTHKCKNTNRQKLKTF